MTTLAQDEELIKRLENDLVQKVTRSINSHPTMSMRAFGVFSLDQLEDLLETDLGGNIGVGVAYFGAQAVTKDRPLNPDRSSAVKTLSFTFVVALAVPAKPETEERHDATTMLTVIRNAILGKPVEGDRIQRTWDFVREGPEISASTDTMLYYSQVWQVAMQAIGTA